MKDVGYFVKPPEGSSVPRAPLLDPATLQVDPESVPSKAYGQTFQMLEMGLSQYPETEVTKSALRDGLVKEEGAPRRPGLPHDHGRHW